MTTGQLSEQLGEIGLTPNQIAVYLELIKSKKCRASALIDATKLHRSIVYTCLDDLVAKGLASKLTQGGVAVFEATSPKNLVEMMDAKRRTAESAADDLVKLMQEAPRDIRIFEGERGVLGARERSLELPAGETVYVLGGSGSTSTPAYEAMWAGYHKKRVSKGINLRVLFDQGVSPDILANRNSLELTQAKYLPFKQDMPAWFDVYGQTFAIGVPSQDPVVFSMRSPEAATALKNFFEYLWNQQVTVETGLDALQKAMERLLGEMETGGTYCVLGAVFREETIGLYTDYHRSRVKKGVKLKMLAYQESIEPIKKIFANAGDHGELSVIKPLSTSPKNPTQIYIYGEKVFMAIMGEVPTVIHFDKPGLHESFQAHFDYLWGQESYVMEGPEALRDIWLEAVEAKELKFIGARGYFIDRYPELFAEVKKKAEKTPGVVWKNIVDPGVRGHAITKFRWSQTRYTPNVSKNPNVVWIYGRKVAVANWSGDTPIIFLSENKQLFQSYNDYFQALWGRGPVG